jgi:hypothetical protein
VSVPPIPISVPPIRRTSALRRPFRAWFGTALATALTLAFAPAALASATTSSNWAGYAVHRSGVTFKSVFGAWTQPSATCTPGTPTFSSVWIGLGGFSTNSRALEQIGSEVDCKASGRAASSVWYELVPASSRKIRMKVNPGDRLSASVAVLGHRVTVTLKDLTRGTSFTRSLRVSQIDNTSADWIVEAPSECAGISFCQPLGLANFGSASITRARTMTTGGHAGTISDHRWVTTKITLATSGRRFINGPAGANGAEALPSSLAAGGSAFTVTYQGPTSAPTTTQDPPGSSTATRLSRPGLQRSRS